jgi:hypothetical protein
VTLILSHHGVEASRMTGAGFDAATNAARNASTISLPPCPL